MKQIAVVLGLAYALGLQGRPPGVFQASNRTVGVFATVMSADARLVTDLARDAFTIYDNGKPQELTFFDSTIQPITVVMLLDRSVSMRENFELVEQAAEKFVDAMLPADKARIGSFSNRIQVDPRDFTSDHKTLVEILRSELQEEGPTPLWNAVNVGITALLHQQGRRVVLVFTDGADSPFTASTTNSTLKSVMKRAEEEDVMVYAVGLEGGRRATGGRYGGGRYGGGRGGGRYTGRSGGRIVAAGPDDGLPKLALATGGGYTPLTSAKDLGATFQKIADELHHQYALGFTPTNLDGKMHKLEVRVADRNLSVRARTSYLAKRMIREETR